MSRRSAVVIAVGLIAVAFAGCGGDGSAEGLSASGAWTRPTTAETMDAVVYLTVVSNVDDAVTSASVPPSVAATADVYDETSGGDGTASHHGGSDDGGAEMDPADRIELEAGVPLDFAPGGRHVMLQNLAARLARGDRFELTLTLASGATLAVDVGVSDNPVNG